MTTVDLKIEDPQGGTLNLCAHELRGKGYVVVNVPNSMLLAEDGAETLVQWLAETFGLKQDPGAQAGPANFLRIVVPGAAGGDPREVTWSGEDEPPAWFEQLAALALAGVTRRSLQEATEAFKGINRQDNPESAQQLLAIRQTLAVLGINVDGASVVEGVHRLAEQARKASELHEALISAGFDGRRTIGDVFHELITISKELRRIIHAEEVPVDVVLDRVRELYRMSRAGMRGETHPSDRSTVRDLMAHLGIDQDGGRAHEALTQRVLYLLADVDRATERANRLRGEVRRLQQDTLVAKLNTAREGLEYARAQFFDPEENIIAVDWDDSVSLAIVERLDKAISESDPEG